MKQNDIFNFIKPLETNSLDHLMRYHITSPHKIKIPLVIKRRAIKFSCKVTKTINYDDSKQYILDKIKNDHFINKLGEEAVCILFKDVCEITEPDYAIYLGRNKSWDSDIKINGIGIGVKTQKTSTARRNGLSWTFQYSHKRKDPILNDTDSWVCFVEYDDVSGMSDTCIIYPPHQIKELQFKEPHSEYLKGNKKVVYHTDLPNK